MSKPIHIVFCLPGANFSFSFVESWTNLLSYCHSQGYKVTVAMVSGSNVYNVRHDCVGGRADKGLYRRPWGGDLDYTHIMWIDSDMVFSAENFQALLDHDLDIVSGAACIQGGKDYAFGKLTEDKRGIVVSKDNSRTVQMPGRVDKKGLLEVDHVGCAFLLVKKGVFEKMVYPWFFEPPAIDEDGTVSYHAEDFSFCVTDLQSGRSTCAK